MMRRIASVRRRSPVVVAWVMVSSRMMVRTTRRMATTTLLMMVLCWRRGTAPSSFPWFAPTAAVTAVLASTVRRRMRIITIAGGVLDIIWAILPGCSAWLLLLLFALEFFAEALFFARRLEFGAEALFLVVFREGSGRLLWWWRLFLLGLASWSSRSRKRRIHRHFSRGRRG